MWLFPQIVSVICSTAKCKSELFINLAFHEVNYITSGNLIQNETWTLCEVETIMAKHYNSSEYNLKPKDGLKEELYSANSLE